MRLKYLALAGLVAMANAETPILVTIPPKDWKEVTVPRKFSFFVPSDFQDQKTKGEDSIVGEYHSLTASLIYDYGAYSNPLDMSQLSSYGLAGEIKEQAVEIDGHRAKLVAYKMLEKNGGYVTAVHFPEVAEDSMGEFVKLTIEIHSNKNEDLAVAKKIFGTIHFKP